jgi:hypothetical protein
MESLFSGVLTVSDFEDDGGGYYDIFSASLHLMGLVFWSKTSATKKPSAHSSTNSGK